MADLPSNETTLLFTSQATAPGEVEHAHYLVVVQGEHEGRRIRLDRKPLIIGRAEPADIVLPDPRVSRSHCRVVLAAGEMVVTDLNSSNGTYVDGQPVQGAAALPVGGRLIVGSHMLLHEWRIRKEVEESQALDRDIEKAGRYIQSLLPAPIADGPVRCEWILVPCARLGGDAFGYRFLDDRRFAMYLIDVSGHGTGAAMHAVSVANVLRQGMLPDADFADPASVLAGLNGMFRMDAHDGMYLTVWYGVYDLEARTIAFASAGHHPSYLVDRERREALPLKTRNLAVGAVRAITFRSQTVAVPEAAMLYVFSDGVFEITTKEGEDWTVDHLMPWFLASPQPGVPEPQRLFEAVRSQSSAPAFDDDFTLLAFTFP